jgi:hypothetical protein
MGSAICGGVISQTQFDSDPLAYMMSWYMEDSKFEAYQMIKNPKEKARFFNKHARSAI